MDKVDGVVIGAGVVGLAVARALIHAAPATSRDWLVLERADAIGTGTSSRNSEVIHAGIYYPPGSLKAALCVKGRDMLYAYAAARGVSHQRCGKLIVATHEDQLPALAAILQKARANGVNDLLMLTAEEAKAMESALSCVGPCTRPAPALWTATA